MANFFNDVYVSFDKIAENIAPGTFLGGISVKGAAEDIVSYAVNEVTYYVDYNTGHSTVDEVENPSPHFKVNGYLVYADAPFDFERMPDNPFGPDNEVTLVLYARNSFGETTSSSFSVTVTDVDETVHGGPGNDRMIGKIGKVNQYDGGAGNDVLTGDAYNDTLNGASGHDRLIGNGGDDLLTGGTGDDVLYGGKGTDTLQGGAGADLLNGGAGGSWQDTDSGLDFYEPNRLTGGLGADRLVDNGDDVFVYTSIKDSLPKLMDLILQWEGDSVIDLSAIDAMSKTAGNNVFRFIGTNSFSGKEGQLRTVKTASDTYVYADINGDKKADFALHLDERTVLHSIDFIL